MIGQFLGYAIPSALAMFVSSLYTIIDGIFVGQGVGDNALAAVTIVMPLTIMLFGIATMFAVGGGALVSKNFGAKNSKNMLDVYKISNIVSIIINVAFTAICFIFGRNLIGIFTSDMNIIEIAYNGLNITNLGFFVVGLNLTTTVYYQAVEDPKYSNLMCILRSVVFLPVSVFILGKILGINGVWISLLMSEMLSLFVVKVIANVKTYTTVKLAA